MMKKKKNTPKGPNNATRIVWAIIKSFVAVLGLLVVDVVLLLPFFILFLLLLSSTFLCPRSSDWNCSELVGSDQIRTTWILSLRFKFSYSEEHPLFNNNNILFYFILFL